MNIYRRTSHRDVRTEASVCSSTKISALPSQGRKTCIARPYFVRLLSRFIIAVDVRTRFVDLCLRQLAAGGLKLESLSNVPRSYMRCMERFGLIPTTFVVLVGSSGLEPPTSRLSGARSNHLSYEPMSVFGVSRLSRTVALTHFIELRTLLIIEVCVRTRFVELWVPILSAWWR